MIIYLVIVQDAETDALIHVRAYRTRISAETYAATLAKSPALMVYVREEEVLP